MSDLKRDWWLDGSSKAGHSVTSDWEHTGRDLVAGVMLKEIRSVLPRHGVLTEAFRRDWFEGEAIVDQAFQVVLEPGALTAWHLHEFTVDRFFVSMGRVKLVLYDSRRSSPTHEMVNELVLGVARPSLVVIPGGIWHGAQGLASVPSVIFNFPDRAYQYDDPDHWALPPNSDRIPYRFGPVGGTP